MNDFSELKNLVSAATKGPWSPLAGSANNSPEVFASATGKFVAQAACEPDAAFIASFGPDVILRMVAENEALTKNYKSLCDSVAHLNAAATSAGDEVARLKSECKALQKDAERLDWIAENFTGHGDGTEFNLRLHLPCDIEAGGLIHAIDLAMSKESSQ